MAKLMIELQQFPTAAEVLESILDEDDNLSEVWFLLAFSLSHFDIPASIDPMNHCKQVRRIPPPLFFLASANLTLCF